AASGSAEAPGRTRVAARRGGVALDRTGGDARVDACGVAANGQGGCALPPSVLALRRAMANPCQPMPPPARSPPPELPTTSDAIPLDLAALGAARRRIGDAATHTAQPYSEPLSNVLGLPLHLKLENLQHTGSFKLRGATNKIACLLESGERPSGVVAASAG